MFILLRIFETPTKVLLIPREALQNSVKSSRSPYEIGKLEVNLSYETGKLEVNLSYETGKLEVNLTQETGKSLY